MELAEGLGRTIDLSEAALAHLVRAVDRSGEARRQGFTSTTAWLKKHLGMRPGRAKERLVLARQLERLPLVDKLMASSELSYGYAATIADAVCRTNDADTAAAESLLLGLKEQDCSAGQVARAAQRIHEVISERDGTDSPPSEARRPFTRSWIEKAKSLDGSSWVKMFLTPEDTAVFAQVLEPLAKPTGVGDDRDHGQRLANALMSVLSQGHRRSPVTIITTIETLEGDDAPGRMPDGTPVPAHRVRQIALNGGVSALVLGPGGHPLYLGRTTRFATPHQRRVLQALYATCAVSGCDIPSNLCEIHHTGGWKLGSPTDNDKLAPACAFHNRWIEENPHRVHTTHDATGRYLIHCLPTWDARNRPGHSPSDRAEPQKGDCRPEDP
ncbi:HNH endonuclease signature motif containing protein [Actinomadura sp. HBU206391]|uniref:HNH endonuclease signature motif containing protein n=1 Tax=Actinomadura sp. HBU206391 TaxID=2731692 RepID=UPI00164EF425|nr:HNH endonuclease signature motif containing protein [Actinomadura sp. HBU206391]MBC6462937.1 DUF222 domain-containing protein [Actinomadura sp. HBU206391]